MRSDLLISCISIRSYKTVLISRAVSAIGIWCLFQWTLSVGAFKFSIVLTAFYHCCEVAYVSYMFDKVSNDQFLAVSALTRTAPLAGHLMNSVVFVTILRKMDYKIYTYLDLISQIAALVFAAIFLNFNRTQPSSVNLRTAPSDMITQVQTAMSNQSVVFYSIWYIFGYGVMYQIMNSVEESMLNFHVYQTNVSVDSKETNKTSSLNDLVKYLNDSFMN